ncbi:MAG: hypothetical protein AAF460_04360 [Pseudomonadota bacterium]
MQHLLIATALFLTLVGAGAQGTTPTNAVASYHVKTLDRHSGYVYRPAHREETRDEQHGRIRGAWFYSAKTDPITDKRIVFAEKYAPDPSYYASKHLGIRVIDVAGKTPLVCVLGHGHDTRRATIAVDGAHAIPMSQSGCLRSIALITAMKAGTQAVVEGFEWHRQDPARVQIDLQSLAVALHHLRQLRSDSGRILG